MKTAIVPAQVTTVEDRIAGNFTFAQLLIVMFAGGLATMVYLLVAPKYHFNPLKLIAILTIVSSIAPLAIRFRGKIVAEWLVILARFWQRPQRYIFTKNDREEELTVTAEVIPTETKPAVSVEASTDSVTVEDHTKLRELLNNPDFAVRFVVAEKGGLNVSVAPLKR